MMNSQRLRSLKPRTKIYAAVVIASIVAVCVRIWLVEMDRGKTIVSFVAEWAREGKPVTVIHAATQDVPVYTKLTVCGEAKTRAAGFVTADIKDKTQEGQDVFSDTTAEPCGRVVGVGKELDIDTGMFPVAIEFNEAIGEGACAVVYVHTGTLAQMIVVPNDMLDYSGNDYYLWKMENGHAKRVPVKLGSRNGYGAVIVEGVAAGDVLIYDGRSLLSENDTVRIAPQAPQRSSHTKGRIQ